MKMNRPTLQSVICIMGGILLSSCTATAPPEYSATHQIDTVIQNSIRENQKISKNKTALPSAVNRALLPGIQTHLPTSEQSSEKHFNLSVKDVSAQSFFMGLVKDTKYNMIVSPEVSGTISLSLKNVTIPEVIQAVQDIYGYAYKQTSYGFQVFPKKLETRIFSVNYLNLSRTGESQTTISSGQMPSGSSRQTSNSGGESASSVKTTSTSDLWKELEKTLNAIIGTEEGRSVIINPQAGIIVIKAYPNELSKIAQYLDDVQGVMNRQVIIEAKVLEVTLRAEYQSGVDWNILGLKVHSHNISKESLQTFTEFLTLDMHKGNAFTSVIKLLNKQGHVRVLSSPHISTLNNQRALIKIGEDRYFVTHIGSAIISNAASNDATQDVDLTPFFSGIALDVTPQIGPNNDVTLHIHPIISNVEEDKKEITVGGKESNIPLAASSIRESDNIIRAHSGQVVVIGGLMETKNVHSKSSTPGADKIPLINGLFRGESDKTSKTELVILLRPIIVDHSSWNKQLQSTGERFKHMKNDIHYDMQYDHFK